MVAEDEYLIGLDVQDALEDAGFTVCYVANVREALETITSNNPGVFGLVTDIKLGAGPDGWEVARIAWEQNARVPIVFMSGDGAHEHPSMGVPDSAMIQKPFAPTQVVTALTALINGAQKFELRKERPFSTKSRHSADPMSVAAIGRKRMVLP